MQKSTKQAKLSIPLQDAWNYLHFVLLSTSSSMHIGLYIGFSCVFSYVDNIFMDIYIFPYVYIYTYIHKNISYLCSLIF